MSNPRAHDEILNETYIKCRVCGEDMSLKYKEQDFLCPECELKLRLDKKIPKLPKEDNDYEQVKVSRV